MWRSIFPALAIAGGVVAFNAAAEEPSHSAATTKDGCKVVERKSGDPSGAMSSTVTAGGGKVSGYTTGGNSVTVHSGDGKTSSSVSTAGSSGGGSTVVTGSGSGDCTIYVDPGKKEEK
jgi:hypothetical protein